MEGDLLVAIVFTLGDYLLVVLFPLGDCLATIIEEYCSVGSFEVAGLS